MSEPDAITFPELPGWAFDVDEVSAGVYRAVGVDRSGRRVEATGTDPDQLLDECRRAAAALRGAALAVADPDD